MSKTEPKQTDGQSLGDIGEKTVQLILTKYKWTADIIKSDFGEDIDCNVFINNTRTNYYLRCQVKSTTKDSEYVKQLKNGDYSVSISSGLLKAWLSSYFPVFLVVYEEDSDLCYWTNPIKQILENPSKLEKDYPSVRVSKDNLLNNESREAILNEVKLFYHKIQRLDEATISCKVTPLLMPNYRVVPFHHFSEYIYNESQLMAEIAGDFIELLPSWMTILKRLDPSSALPSIKFSSTKIDLDEFLTLLQQKLKNFHYKTKDNEWISFIVSPIEIQSNNSSWFNELTYWTSYSRIGGKLVNDTEYNFEAPTGFLGQVSRRARSWDFYQYVNPKKDIAIQFFSCYEVTPSIRNIDKVHSQNIKGQLILWECKKEDLEEVANQVTSIELAIKLIDDSNELCLIAITNPMFDPFIGLYSVAMDWDSFENGSVRNKLEKNEFISIIPGHEYTGEMPDFLKEVLNRYDDKKYTKALVTEMEYIAGYPLMHDERGIQVSRFQMIQPSKASEIELKAKNIKSHVRKKHFRIDFGLKDDSMWQVPIYELAISWSPDLLKSSKDDFIENEAEILRIMDEILPTKKDDTAQLKSTFEILHIAGEIGFEKYNEL
ncbi:DUF4365 domain-containing protein [Algoriphagus sp. D3-2-R+10]|uniref:DUF4365 domain-containing protein n=1 Tax=Algoriphagus aurantiacus TaxID=3103948 RepID=UPI002B39D2BD|nr:DUF4365 domain-containing protein [Algoriphagus sp. D3-2-R+10]MEB2773669.1 DUF4365 domain-containing protein [Algoriphagus sp. D3-2-R+10]